MLDLKTELGEVGIPFEPIDYWVKAPAYPYGTFDDVVDIRGSDLPSAPKVITHKVSITVYHKSYDEILKVQNKLIAWADARALTYVLHIKYIDDEDHLGVTLTSTITEKERMIHNGSN